MPHSLQEFLATSTITAAGNLEKALLRLPEEKRNWKPDPDSRSALDQVAECAIMNGRAIEMICSHVFPDNWAYLAYADQIRELVEDWPKLQTLLHENAAKVAEVIRTVSNDALEQQEELADSLSYPFWNMTYHEGQINYLASMLGYLD